MAFTSSYTEGLIQQSEYHYGIPNMSLSGSFSGSFSGNGSALTGVGGDAFPFTGDAQITGSLIVSGSTPLIIQGGTENADTVLLVEEVGGVDLLTVKGDGEVVINNANNGLTGKLSFGNGISDGFIYMQDSGTGPSSKYSIPQRTNNDDSSLQFWVGNAVAGPKLFPHKDTSQGLADRSVIENDFVNSSNYSRGLDFIVGGTSPSLSFYQSKLWRFFSWDGVNDPDSGNVERLSIGNSPLTTGGDAIIAISASRVGINTPSPSASLEINPPSGSFPSLIVSGSSEFIGNVSGSAISTSSFGTYLGDGSQLTNLPASSTFPFTGSAIISGSVDVTGSLGIRSLSSGTQNLLEIINNGGTKQLQIGNTGIIALGDGATNTSAYNQVFGGNASTAGEYVTVIGYDADHTSGTRAIAIGASAKAEGTGAVAIGVGAQAQEHSIVIGRNIADASSPINSVVFSTFGGNNVTYSTSNAFEWYNTHATAPNLRFLTGPTSQSFWSGSGGFFGFGTTTPDAPLTVEGSGSTVFDVIGSVGTLFSVDDDLSGTIFTANDISGLPILQADSTGEVYLGKSPQSLYTTAVISATSASATASVSALSTSSYDGALFDYTCISASNTTVGSIMSTWNGGTVSFNEYATSSIGTTYRTAGLDLQVIISQSQAQLVAITDSTSPNTWKVKTIIKAI